MIKKFMVLSALTVATLFASEVKITDIYAKATPPHAPASAVFMKIQNNTDQNVYLLGGSSSISKATEVHKHLRINGMMKMVKLENVMIPAHDTLTLKPGGYHIMLIGLNQDLKPNDKIDLKLNISTNPDSKQPQTITIKDINVKRFNHNMAHDMSKEAHKHCNKCKKHAKLDMQEEMKMQEHMHDGCQKPKSGSLMGTCSSK